MLRKTLRIGAIALVAVLAVGAVAVWVLPGNAEARFGERQIANGGPALVDRARSVPIVDDGDPGELSESETEALLMALDDEYKAWSVYDQIIDDLGAVRPFTNIQKAEESHIAALVRLFDRYGLEVPVNEWPGAVPTFDTLAEACETGVQAEIDNAALYDQLLSMVDNPDLVQVFGALQQASQTKHLPAFERCAR